MSSSSSEDEVPPLDLRPADVHQTSPSSGHSSSGSVDQSHPRRLSAPHLSSPTKATSCDGKSKDRCGCEHYKRRCAYVSPCCQKVYSCRICHDAKESHQINRHAVMEIVCTICSTRQPVSRKCISCGVEFGRYFCEICRLYDDQDKKQFHCDQCGICRVDGRENFFHCPKCDICLCINLKDSHKCVEKVTHGDCPVCLEDLHTSRESLTVLSCGHITHRKCFRELLKTGNYACPLCCHTMVDMEMAWRKLDEEIRNTPMPDEYKNKRIAILCRDCNKNSVAKFHIFGLKCGRCGSYNTCRTASSTDPSLAEEEEEAEGEAGDVDSSGSSSPPPAPAEDDHRLQQDSTDGAGGASRTSGHRRRSAPSSSSRHEHPL